MTKPNGIGKFPARLAAALCMAVILLLTALPHHGAGPAPARPDADTLYRQGSLSFARGAYSEAMDYYLRARKIATQGGDTALLARVYTEIGNVYAANGDFPDAIAFYTKALPISGGVQHGLLKSQLLTNLMKAYVMQGDTDSARYYFRRFRRFGEKMPNFAYNIEMGQALIAEKEGRPAEAARHYRQAAMESKQRGLSVLGLASAYSCLAGVYDNAGQPDSAARYYLQAERILRPTTHYPQLAETLLDLGNVYGKMGAKEQSLEYKTRYLNLSDSINSRQEYAKFQTSLSHYELEMSASEIEELNAEKRAQRLLILFITLAAILFAALLVIVIIQKRRLKRAYTDLFERSRQQLRDEEERKSRRTPVVNDDQRQKIAADIRDCLDSTDDYCSPDFSIDALAAKVGSNPRYVSEAINREFGINFKALLNEYRVRKAMVRLGDIAGYGNLTIKAIAESVGYKSQATFIAAFTAQTGLKPSIYQRLAREKSGRAAGAP